MKEFKTASFSDKTTHYISSKTPFIFIVDYDKSTQIALSFKEASEQQIFFKIGGKCNHKMFQTRHLEKRYQWDLEPVSPKEYQSAFEKVMDHINHGNSFLLNLTFPTKLTTNISLKDMYALASAPYKLLYQNQFVCFSPECFIKIKGEYIYSYPMKGTIDASLANAENSLLHNQKETREHYTIVDLIRNDLSMVAKEVTVKKFRYAERIQSVDGELIQTSSEIRGKLLTDWRENFGKILLQLLPAGSICGAPKRKTIDIIKEIESTPRGFYTGIFGIFDGHDIDCAVSIRFVENESGQLLFRSGGGITHKSLCNEEYQELIQKIYVPTI